MKHDVSAIQCRVVNTLNPLAYVRPWGTIVRRRFRALKKLQAEVISLESKFFKEVHNLRCEYENHCRQLLEKRYQIVSAQVEPDDDECWCSSDDDNESEALKHDVMVPIYNSCDQDTSNVKGVPNFWLRIFKNVDILEDMLGERDEPILRHLQDVRVKLLNEEDSKGFTLEFVFEPNEFFTDAVLTKQYEMGFEPNENDLSYEGPKIIKCTGCTINWKEGKNVTFKWRLFKLGAKSRKVEKAKLTKKIITDKSFFNFFNPPQVSEGGKYDKENQIVLMRDYKIGCFLRDCAVPKAFLYCTGEALKDEDEHKTEDGAGGDMGDGSDQDPIIIE